MSQNLTDADLTGSKPFSPTELSTLFEPLCDYDDVFVAVSGGADSTALMHLLARWRDEVSVPARSAQLRFVILTVDHRLRTEAAAEARSVVLAANALGFDAETLTWSGEIPVSGVQQAAREIRYHLLSQRVDKAVGRAVLVMAHHRDDLAETVLMRLARGGGVDGLAAMDTLVKVHGVTVFRPLLEVAKSRLVASLIARGTRWSEDPSNANQDFERVRLRHANDARSVLGLTDEALALTSARMSRARRALDSWVEKLLLPELNDQLLARAGIFTWRWRAGDLQDEIGVRLLQRILPGLGGSDKPLRLMRVERLYEAMQHEDFQGATLGNCNVKWSSRHSSILIFREPHRARLPTITWADGEPGPLIWDNRFKITRDCAGQKDAAPVRVRAMCRTDLEGVGEKPVLTSPIEALEATPIIENDAGWLIIPALDVQRQAGQTGFEPLKNGSDGYVCRFRTDLFRLGSIGGEAQNCSLGR